MVFEHGYVSVFKCFSVLQSLNSECVHIYKIANTLQIFEKILLNKLQTFLLIVFSKHHNNKKFDLCITLLTTNSFTLKCWPSREYFTDRSIGVAF